VKEFFKSLQVPQDLLNDIIAQVLTPSKVKGVHALTSRIAVDVLDSFFFIEKDDDD
jgi:hypothetical protein